MDKLLQDLRYSLRLLRRNPGFAVVAVLALTLGMGANTAIFSIVNTVLLHPLPYPEPARLMYLDETNPTQGFEHYGVSYPNYLEWERRTRNFGEMAAVRRGGMTLTGNREPARLSTAFVTPVLLPMLGALPAIGRSFAPEDNQPGAEPVVLVSHGLWQRRFAGAGELLGQALTLNGTAHTVIGVMPPDFHFPSREVEVWGPLGSLADTRSMNDRQVHFLSVIGRLAPGATLAGARAEMETVMAQIHAEFPGEDPGHSVGVRSLHDRVVRNARPALIVLLGAAAFVLLIACTNVANLLLARSAARDKEMAVRAALGASRARTIRQLLTESVLLALLGGACSLLVATWAVDLVASRLVDVLPRAQEIRIDGAVLLFTLALSLVTSVLFGLVPAWQVTRSDQSGALKDRGGTTSTGFGRRRVRHALIVTEVALSLVLLIGAALMLKSFWHVLQQPPGFQSDHLLLMTVSLPPTEYPDTDQVIRFYQDLPGRLEAFPGIESVSAVNTLPISGGDSNGQLTIEGRPFPPGAEPGASFRRILPNYFRAMGVPLLRGREFDARDDGAVYNVIINETMARRYFPDEDPLGKRIKVGPSENEPWLTIVGVVGDVRNVGLDEQPALATYEPHPQRPWRTMQLVLRTDSEPADLAEAVRRSLQQEEPGLLIANVTTMNRHIDDSQAPRRLHAILLGLFAAVAVVLAAIGLYGVMSYLVTRRTHEIGVRVALGAQKGDILKMVVHHGMRLAILGVGLGVGGALTLTHLLKPLLYEVSPTDPVAFTAVSVLLVAVALLASYFPARRATRVDPIVALRYD